MFQLFINSANVNVRVTVNLWRVKFRNGSLRKPKADYDILLKSSIHRNEYLEMFTTRWPRLPNETEKRGNKKKRPCAENRKQNVTKTTDPLDTKQQTRRGKQKLY
jgi:hypothetical protein